MGHGSGTASAALAVALRHLGKTHSAQPRQSHRGHRPIDRFGVACAERAHIDFSPGSAAQRETRNGGKRARRKAEKQNKESKKEFKRSERRSGRRAGVTLQPQTLQTKGSHKQTINTLPIMDTSKWDWSQNQPPRSIHYLVCVCVGGGGWTPCSQQNELVSH